MSLTTESRCLWDQLEAESTEVRDAISDICAHAANRIRELTNNRNASDDDHAILETQVYGYFKKQRGEKPVVLNFENTKIEIAAGRAKTHALWVLLSDEKERDGYALKPEVWEGPGEYQQVTHQDGRSVYVHIPFGKQLY